MLFSFTFLWIWLEKVVKKEYLEKQFAVWNLICRLISVYWNGHTDLINIKILAKGRTSKQAAFKINYTVIFNFSGKGLDKC